jgi:hypothetical protein
VDFIDALDDWLEDRWRALRKPWSPRQRARRLQWGGVASLSLAVHMAVLFYFGSQLTDAYRLPEPPPEIVEPVEPVEAILVPPPEPVVEPEPVPELRSVTPEPQPAPTPVPTPPTPTPSPAPTPTPSPAPPRPVPAPPTPAPPRPAPPLPFQAAPQTPSAVSANRPVVRVNPVAAPTLPDPTPPAPPAAAPPAPRPAPPAPKKEEEDEDRPIARNAPPTASPRQVAPNAAPLTVAPLQMAPTPRAASPAGALPGAGASNRPPPPGGANGDFTVRPSGQVGGGLRGALRQTVGCDNRNAVALNKGERNTCDESVGVRGANAPGIAVGTELDRDKFDRMRKQVETNDAARAYKNGTGVGGAAPQGNTSPRIRDLVGGR